MDRDPRAVEEADSFPYNAAAQAFRPSVAPPTVESTYKTREAEGWIDIHFYRKLGLQLAIFFRKLGWTPTMVTLLGGVFGVVAGHLYYYRDLRTNIVGMVLHVAANLLDNADGQLARLTNKASRSGRITDSVVDHVIFINMYFHLGFRCLAGSTFPVVALVAFPAGFSHALQGAAADYYRNAYLYFVTGRARGDFDSAVALRLQYQTLTWRDQFWKKLLLALYLNFTRQQEMLSPNLKRLRATIDGLFHSEIPDWFKARYRDLAKPAFKWWGGLMTNTRMLLLFFCLFVDRPMWFFWIELTAFNVLLIYLLMRQENMCRSLLCHVERSRDIP
jgi:hypothetical protein